MTLKEINDEISRLQTIKRKMHEDEVNKQKDMARKFVGKCYTSSDGSIFKIIGIPRTRLTMMDGIYNPYKFPALVLQYPDKLRETYISDNDDFVPFCYDEVYFNVWDDKSKNQCRFHEMSKEAFDARFNECLERYKKLIDEMVMEYEV